MKHCVFLACVLLLCTSLYSQNMVRNGSFESGKKYWLNPPSGNIKTKGAFHGNKFYDYGEKNHYIRSTPMMIEPDTELFVTCMVKLSKPGKAFLHLDLLPTNRTSGNGLYRSHWGRHGWGVPVKLTDKWQKAVWKINTPGKDFKWRNQMWDKKSWIIMLQGQNVSIDAFTITKGEEIPQSYVSYNSVSVGMHCTNLPGYMEAGNILAEDFIAKMSADLFNNTSEDMNLEVKWQQLSYDNVNLFYEKTERVKVKAGEGLTLFHKMGLHGKGLVLARCAVFENGKLKGRSDQPLTSLAFPKNFTRPNPEEAFGGSLNGGPVLEASHRIGLAWSRWYPHTKWSTIQPDGPEKFNFPDQQVEELTRLGISMNFVLYSLPKWAKGKHHNLPKDMEDWKSSDERWKDLKIETYWDKYVKTMVNRYKDYSVAWEIVNEPVFEKWDPEIYKLFIERTYRQIKKIDPKLKVMIDAVYGINGFNEQFLKAGGTDCWDVYTWHNYSTGPFATYGHVKAMHEAFKAFGRKKPAEIWFNEGWAHTPSSIDDGVHSIIGTRSPAMVADDTVRAIAETFSAGQQKMIVFNMGYPEHGRSWWDWGTDGTQWWDDEGNPTVMAALFNVLVDQLGLNTPVARIPLKNGMVNIFEDKRNGRGVAVFWSTKEKQSFDSGLTGLTQMDLMGNKVKLASTILKTGRRNQPWYVFGDQFSAADLKTAFEKLRSSEISIADGSFKLPKDWQEKGKDANPYTVMGKSIWRFDKVFPPDSGKVENFHTMKAYHTTQSKWFATENSQGGNPAASVQNGVRITAITQWKSGDQVKPSALVFIAPAKGTYTLKSIVNARRWTGKAKEYLELVKINRAKNTAELIFKCELEDSKDYSLSQEFGLEVNEELAIVFKIDHGMNSGAGLVFKKLEIIQASDKVDFSEETIRKLNQ